MMTEIILLILALCTDIFFAGVVYGAEKIRIPFRYTVLINGICSGCLGIALLCGGWIDRMIPEMFTRSICFLSFLLIGIFKLVGTYCRTFLKKYSDGKNISFTFSGIKYVIRIYADPLTADADQSKALSAGESIVFALAMSVDSFIAGTLAAFMKIPTGVTMISIFAAGEVFLYAGMILGRKAAGYSKMNLSWLGGIFFIFLAFWKTFI